MRVATNRAGILLAIMRPGQLKRWLPVHCQYVSILCGDLVDLTSEPCSFDYFWCFLGLCRFQEGFQLLAEELGDARQNPDWTFSWGRLTVVVGVLKYLLVAR